MCLVPTCVNVDVIGTHVFGPSLVVPVVAVAVAVGCDPEVCIGCGSWPTLDVRQLWIGRMWIGTHEFGGATVDVVCARICGCGSWVWFVAHA